MTATERANLIGRRGTMTYEHSSGDLEFPVNILDAREAYGRLDVLVTPAEGSGQAWVSADRVKVRGR